MSQETVAIPKQVASWQRALITGASAGIGAAFADLLASEGTDLVLVARHRDRLELRAADLRSRYGVAAEIIVADLTVSEDLRRVEARLEATECPFDLLVNNAGSETEHGAFLNRNRELLDSEARLNALALMRLTHAGATAMVSRGRGSIVNVSAGVAFYPTPGSAAYAASKAFVNSISAALAYELRGSGVRVTAVCPGFTPTGAQVRLGLHTDWIPRPFLTDPADVALAALRAARRGRVICSPTRADGVASFLGHHLPRRMWLPGVAHAQARLAGSSGADPVDYRAALLVDLVDGHSRQRRAGVWIAWLVGIPVLGRWFAKLARSPMQMRSVTTRVTSFHALLLRVSRGRLRRSWLFAAGQPVLSLTTIGRRSALPRSTTVACFRSGDSLAVAAMNLGSTRDPDWALNLQANPNATIALANRNIEVTARRAVGEEAMRLWERWVELQPSAEAFRELSGREIPLFVLSRKD